MDDLFRRRFWEFEIVLHYASPILLLVPEQILNMIENRIKVSWKLITCFMEAVSKIDRVTRIDLRQLRLWVYTLSLLPSGTLPVLTGLIIVTSIDSPIDAVLDWNSSSGRVSLNLL